MKFYYPKDMDGNVIGFKTPESQVYDSSGTSLTTKLNTFIKGLSISGSVITYTKGDGTTGTITVQTGSSYTAGTGISISGTTISNSGVRSVSAGSTNGTISVNTNGTSAEVAVKGLGSAAYTASSAYAAASHGTHVSYSTTAPAMNGTASVGTASTVSRSDHVHPVDTSRAAASHTHSEYAAASHTHSGYASSSHTHSYAGSSSAGGSATSAVKLDSSAGSATQPVYFSSGKPVACTYTLGKSVPSSAVFTDTNTMVTQTNTTTNANYRVLFSANANDTTETTTARKSANLIFNPSTGGLTATKVYNAVWNDYAEYFERGESTEPGDIISFDYNSEKETYIKATTGDLVCGIHSDTYGHIVGGIDIPEDYEGSFEDYNITSFIPVGLKGRVKCKVIGKIKKMDKIYASEIPGVGRTYENGNDLSFVGYALDEYNDEENIGIVKVLLK